MLPVNSVLDEKRKSLEEEIMHRLQQTDMILDEARDTTISFLTVLPETHYEHLLLKLQELEGEDVSTVYTRDTTDMQAAKKETEVIAIRDAIRSGDMDKATTLAKSIAVTI